MTPDGSQFLKFSTIEECFVHTIRDTAAKRSRVVVLLDLPDGDWIYNTRKRTIDAAGQRAQWLAVCGYCCQRTWVVIAVWHEALDIRRVIYTASATPILPFRGSDVALF